MSKKIHTIQSSNTEEFDRILNEHLDLGWKVLKGGYSTNKEGEHIIYSQVVYWEDIDNVDATFYDKGRMKRYRTDDCVIQWYEDGKIMLKGQQMGKSEIWELMGREDLCSCYEWDFFDRNGNHYKGYLKHFSHTYGVGNNLGKHSLKNASYLFFNAREDHSFYKIFRHITFREYPEDDQDRFENYGQRHGKYTRFHGNGYRSQQVNYVNGVKKGTNQFWFDNGVTEAKQFLKVEKDVDRGTKVLSINHGKWIHYWRNGEKRWTVKFNKGNVEGMIINYSRNGVKIAQCEKKTTESLENCKVWYSNGKIKEVGGGWYFYLHSYEFYKFPNKRNKHGTWTYYKKNGSKEFEKNSTVKEK